MSAKEALELAPVNVKLASPSNPSDELNATEPMLLPTTILAPCTVVLDAPVVSK